MQVPSRVSAAQPSPVRRLAGLMACLAVGVGVGFAGTELSGSDAWYLAIPVAIAAGWWFVADPTRCGCAGAAAKERGAGRTGRT